MGKIECDRGEPEDSAAHQGIIYVHRDGNHCYISKSFSCYSLINIPQDGEPFSTFGDKFDYPAYYSLSATALDFFLIGRRTMIQSLVTSLPFWNNAGASSS